MSKTDEKFRASVPSSELVIVPLDEHHNLLPFNCSNHVCVKLQDYFLP